MNAAERAQAIAARHRKRLDFDPRAEMPECTAFIDDIREHLGAPVYIHAQENGREVKWGRTPLPGRWHAVTWNGRL